jgi:hypothetical protein
VVLVAAPIAGAPTQVPALAARLVAAILAGYLLWIAARARDVGVEPSPAGWAAEAAAAIAGAVIGFGTSGLGGPAAGEVETMAGAFALVAVAIRPVVRGVDSLGLGIGLILVLVAASLLWSGLGGPLGAVEELVVGILFAAVAGAVALVTIASRGTSGSLELAMAGPRRVRGMVQPGGAGPAIADQGRPSLGHAHRATPAERVATPPPRPPAGS